MNAGEIRVDLELHDSHFRLTAREAGRVLRSLEQQLGQVGKGVNKLESHFSSFTTKLRHTVVTLMAVRFAAIDFYDIFLRLPRAILATSGEIERLTKLMEGLSMATDAAGRKGEGAKNLQTIFDLARKAPFEVKTLADAFVKFKVAGVDPMNGSLQTMIDSVARFGGTSETMHRASVAIQQMAGKGVISMEELRQQLGEAVPDAMKAMARGAGISMAELVRIISKGEAESISALNRMFAILRLQNAGLAEQMMTTWPGMLARLKTEWQVFADMVAKSGFADSAKNVISDLISMLSSKEAAEFARDFGQLLSQTVKVLHSMATALRENWDIIKGLAIAVGALWATSKVYEFYRAMAASSAQMAGPYRAALQGMEQAHQNTYIERMRWAKLAVDQEIAHAAVLRAAETDLARYRVMSNGRYRDSLNGNRIVQMATVAAAQAHVGALRQQMTALEQHTARVTASAVAVERLSIGTRAASIAKMGMASVLGALGGPVGIAITAIMGLVTWWALTESAIDKATRAQERFESAQRGASTRKNIQEVEDEIDRLERAKAAMGFAQIDPNATQDSIVAYQVEMEKIDAAILAKQKELALHQKNVARHSVEADLAAQERAADEVIAKVREAGRLKKAALDIQYKNEFEAAQGNAEKLKKVKEKFAAEDRKVAMQVIDDEISAVQAVMEGLNRVLAEQTAAADENGKRVTERLIARQTETLARLSQEWIRARDIGTMFTQIPKNDGTGKARVGRDPMITALERAKSEVDVMLEKIADIEEGVITFESLKHQALLVLEGKRKAGDFDFVDKNKQRQMRSEQGSFFDPSTPSFQMAQDIASQQAQDKLLVERGKILKGLHGEVATSTLKAAEAYARLGENQAGLPEAVVNFDARIAKLARTMAEQDGTLANFAERTDEIRQNMLLESLAEDSAVKLQKNMQLRAELQDTDRERMEVAYQAEVKKIDDLFKVKVAALMKSGKLTTDEQAKLENMTGMHYETLRLMAEKHARDMETPMQRLNREWQDVTKQMEQATVQWANRSVDAFLEFTKTGKFSFTDMADSILMDILRIQLQQKVVGPAASGLEGMFKNMFGAGSGAPAGMGTGMTTGLETGTWLANGGIMSRFGNVARRYANGGIANRPQMAIFGEGSRPEAYVPLPDGKRIPVAMAGGGANVQVNVINQSGTPVDAQSSQPRFDGKQIVLDVVLTAARQPGPFRDGMRQAVGS